MKTVRESKRGAVLIAVLLVLAAGSYLMVESGRYLRLDYESAATRRTMVAGGSLLASGLTLAMGVLKDDLTSGAELSDHRFDDWMSMDAVFAEVSDSLVSGEISGTVRAEDGKLPLNMLSNDAMGEIFVRLVAALCAAHGVKGDPAEYLTSIRIWLGDRDTHRDTQWYAGADPSYSIPGQGFRTPGELALVRWNGVGPKARRIVLHGANGIPGLLDLVTVWGTGQININLAPRPVVRALCPEPSLGERFANAVEAYRSSGGNIFSTAWYDDLALRVGIPVGTFPSTAVTVRSTVFRVELEARVGGGVIRSTSIVRRVDGRCVVLLQNIH